jgi:alkylation response protein AidB-like acyl-CoA dehydrogenase
MSEFELFKTSDEHEELRAAVRKVAEDKIAPHAAEVDETAAFPQAAYDALRAGDFHAAHIPEDYEDWSLRSLRVLGGFAVLAGFVGFFSVLGFVPSAFLILFIWMKVLARESWWISLVLAIAGAFALNYIFVDVFAVPFPPGLVEITSGG